jgi:hypothetical protein
MTLDDLDLSDKEFDEKYKNDKRTMYCVIQQEGALIAVDFWCLRYIDFPVKIRYTLLYKLLCWWGSNKFAKWLSYRKLRK